MTIRRRLFVWWAVWRPRNVCATTLGCWALWRGGCLSCRNSWACWYGVLWTIPEAELDVREYAGAAGAGVAGVHHGDAENTETKRSE